MSVIGIVCELNPFHNGHKYLIDSVKKDGDIVVAVMSGNFVQRGEPALFPKEIRVNAALQNGFDIVLELPFVYATASAEIFAYSAVKILDAFGCDKIAFGTENTDISKLSEAVKILNKNDFDKKVKEELEKGINYPSARNNAFSQYGVDCDISTPNNILAVEYIKALCNLDSDMIPVAVNRLGAGYNDDFSVGGFASATHIRNIISDNGNYCDYIPENCVRIYKDAIDAHRIISKDKYSIASMSILRTLLKSDMSNIANMAEGLENRICQAINISVGLDEIYDKAKTKRFTHSRIRRAVLSAVMGVKTEDLKISVPYCRLLGFNQNVSKEMGVLAKKCRLPFITSYSDIQNFDDSAKRIFQFECTAGDFFNLILEKTCICSTEMTFSPVKFK